MATLFSASKNQDSDNLCKTAKTVAFNYESPALTAELQAQLSRQIEEPQKILVMFFTVLFSVAS